MPVRLLFLADPQLGCYAAFSGLSDEEIADLAGRGLVVRRQPATTGCDWDAAHLRAALDLGLALSPDVVVLGGDMVHDLADDGQVAALLGLLAEVPDGIAVHRVPGNHDVALDAVTPTAAAQPRSRRLVGPPEVEVAHDGVSLVILDTTLLDRPEHMPDEAEAHLAAVESALAAAAARPGPTIVLGHHPLYLHDPDEPDGYWTVGRPARAQVLGLLERHRPDLVLSGHLHRNHTIRHRGIEMVTTSAVGYPLGADPAGIRVVDAGPEGVHHRFVPLPDQGWLDP